MDVAFVVRGLEAEAKRVAEQDVTDVPRIPRGYKYACFLFRRFPVDADVPDEPEGYQLAEDMRVLRGPPVDPDAYWREWLGSLRIDTVREGNFGLLATMPSQTPEVVDGENEALVRRVDHVFHGLLLQGVPVYEYRGGASLAGGNVAGNPDVRTFADLDTMRPSFGLPRVSVGRAQLARAARLAEVLERVTAGEDWQRFRRGYFALFRGLRDKDGGRRLRLFVQALEGLIKPEIARSRRQFVHRCRTTLARANAAVEQLLGEMYDIRSHVEHLHSPLDALTSVPLADRLDVAHRRTRQGELLARFAFIHVLESPDLLETFRSDDAIDAFWRTPDDERARSWGERLDLEAVP